MTGKKLILLCAVIAVTACFCTYMLTSTYLTDKYSNSEVRISDEDYDTMKQYLEVSDLQKLINENYYEEEPTSALVDGALKGMVSALDDEYSVYYTESEYKEYLEKNDGSFVGIGVYVTINDSGYLQISALEEGGPAAQAGLAAGDVIVAIDNTDISKKKADEVYDMLKGPTGSAVSVTVSSGGEEKTVDIIRAEMISDYVYYTMLDSDIVYVSISEFHGDVSASFEGAVKFAREENAKGMIIDVRNNLGGSVKECVEICDQILPEGIVAYTVGRDGERTDYQIDADYFDIPLTVLVNDVSASASEVLAGAVQDMGRGKIVGETTYGKGVVQVIADMPYSGGGVKLTSALYYTPQNKCINGIGITPDVEVMLSNDVASGMVALSRDTDNQLTTAVDTLKAELGIAPVETETEAPAEEAAETTADEEQAAEQ